MDKAILITYDKEDAINEAKGLCEAAGYEVVHIIQQNYLQKPKYGISGGVLEQLREIADKIRPDVIVFDEILKPSQNYNLATELQREVLDREGLILEIFESRASSSESKSLINHLVSSLLLYKIECFSFYAFLGPSGPGLLQQLAHFHPQLGRVGPERQNVSMHTTLSERKQCLKYL